MSQALPMFIALIITGTLSKKTHELFSGGLATGVDLLIFIGIYYLAYKIFKHYRDL